MKRMMRRTIAGVTMVAGLALAGGAAQAHGIWFAQRAQQLALIYGVGSDDLNMVRRLPLLSTMSGYDASWAPVPITITAEGPIPVVRSETPYVAVGATMDYGLWSKTADGRWFNNGRDQTPDAVLAEHTFKYAVHLTALNLGEMPALPGHRLQVTPVGGAIPEDMGSPLTVRVTFDGQPVAGAQLKTDYVNDTDMPPMMTGPDGTATFRIRNQGLNVIAAIVRLPSPEPEKADVHEHLATLTFVLPHAPE